MATCATHDEALVEGGHRAPAPGSGRARARARPGRPPGTRSRPARPTPEGDGRDRERRRPGTARRSRGGCASAARRPRSRRQARPRARSRGPRTNRPAMSASPKPGFWIHSMKPSTSRTATGSFMPGLALERAGQAAPQGRRPQDREDGRRVGGGQHRPEQQALERREVEQPGGHEPGHHRRADRADEGQADRRAHHGPDLAPARTQVRPRTGSAPARSLRSCGPARSRRNRSSRCRPSRSACRRPSTSTSAGTRKLEASRDAPRPAASSAPPARISSPSVIGPLTMAGRLLLRERAAPAWARRRAGGVRRRRWSRRSTSSCPIPARRPRTARGVLRPGVADRHQHHRTAASTEHLHDSGRRSAPRSCSGWWGPWPAGRPRRSCAAAPPESACTQR